MVISKLRLIVVAGILGGVVWFEHAQQVRIEAPTPQKASVRPAQVCPDNESVPFSPECMAFIEGTYKPVQVRRIEDTAPASSSELP